MVQILAVKRARVFWLQWTGAFGAMLMLFVIGLMLGWSSPYLALLTSEDSPLPVTAHEASWIASLINFGRLFGAVIGALAVQLCGARRTLILIGFPTIVCWVSVIVADSAVWLYAARFACGISMGMAFSSFPLFLGEITDPATRGALVTFASTGLPIGCFAGSAIGALVSMTTFSYVSLVPNLAFIGVFLAIPESPSHLVGLEKLEEAEESVRRYHPRADAKAEIEALKVFMNSSARLSFPKQVRQLMVSWNRRASLVIVLLFTFMQFSGVNTVVFYMEIILTRARLVLMPAATVVIVSGAFSIPAGWVAMYLADKCGRRVLLVASSLGVGLAMLGLGTHFALVERGWDPDDLQWLPFASVIVVQTFVYIGLAPVPSIVMSELFAPNVKSVAACLGSFSGGVFAFVATKSYQPLIDAIGEAYVFWLHALVMLLPVAFGLTIMPETRGKSLGEIQAMLRSK